MNAESFIQYVKQLSRLYQLPYEELKSLSMQYPYFQNLHLLLALKSKLEDHPDYQKNLNRASTYSVDRAQLYRTLTKLEKLALEERFLMTEDFLELQEIQKVEEKLKELELVPEEEAEIEIPKFIENTSTDSIPPSFQESSTRIIEEDEWEDSTELEINLSEPIISKTDLPTHTQIEDHLPINLDVIIANIAAGIGAIESKKPKPKTVLVSGSLLSPKLDIEEKKRALKAKQVSVHSKKPKPMPKQSFSSWIEQFQPAHVKPHLNELMEIKKREKRSRQKSNAAQDPNVLQGANLEFFAQKSIQENDEMASETLAELLVAQMQYQKAIKVYERLILIFPEKSAFFADKIENLKKLIA